MRRRRGTGCWARTAHLTAVLDPDADAVLIHEAEIQAQIRAYPQAFGPDEDLI
jgi:hypothetical protein